jgi:hypothetical protein
MSEPKQPLQFKPLTMHERRRLVELLTRAEPVIKAELNQFLFEQWLQDPSPDILRQKELVDNFFIVIESRL